LAEPWKTETIDFVVASGSSTLISFVETANSDMGNNDSIIAGVGLVASTTTTSTSVPEVSTWAMKVLGFAGLAFASYRSRKAVSLSA
jgi:hypothetical protein